MVENILNFMNMKLMENCTINTVIISKEPAGKPFLMNTRQKLFERAQKLFPNSLMSAVVQNPVQSKEDIKKAITSTSLARDSKREELETFHDESIQWENDLIDAFNRGELSE